MLRPSWRAARADSRPVRTVGPYVSKVTSVPSSTVLARSNGSALVRPATVSTSPLSQYRRFGSKKITGSSELIDCWIMANASAASAQATTRRPAVWAKITSGDSLWCSTAPMPPPNGMRITIGRLT